jgi:hypothetical protein
LGAKSLISQTTQYQGVQWSLPLDQWHKDVTHWFHTILAAVQASFVDTTIGPESGGFGQLKDPPLNEEEKKMWASQVRSSISFIHVFYIFLSRIHNSTGKTNSRQKIRSSKHSSFSLFGLLFTLLTGGFIVSISYALEPILALLHRRC